MPTKVTGDFAVQRQPAAQKQGSIEQLLVAALARDKNKPRESTGEFQIVAKGQLDREQVRTALAMLLEMPAAELTDASLDETVTRIEAAAERHAVLLAAYLDGYVEHLRAIGCTTQQAISDYLAAREHVLRKLHFEASRAQPSPARLKLLALQFALDARHAIDGNVYRFNVVFEGAVAVVREYPSPGGAMSAIPCPGRTVRDPVAVSLFRLLDEHPPQMYELLRVIEQWLEGCPSDTQDTSETVPAPATAVTADLEEPSVTMLNKTYVLDLPLVAFVGALAAAKGGWVPSTELQEIPLLAAERRIDRLVAKLPPRVRKHIEGQSGKGYRLMIENLA